MSHKYTSFSANEFNIIGRLVSVRPQEDKTYLKVATTEKYQNQNEEWKERDEFHHLTVFSSKTAGKVQTWAPGDIVQVKGRINSWQDGKGDDFKAGVVLKVKEAKRIAKKEA